MELTFGAFDDRPELLLADIAEAKALRQVNIASKSNIQQTSQVNTGNTSAEPVAASEYYPETVASNTAQPATGPAMPDFGDAQKLDNQPVNIPRAETF